MRAILRTEFGGPEVLVIREMPEPEPKDGHVVIEVKAFGLNHAEMHMRKGEWAEIADVSGIECVGLIKSCPGGEFAIGTKAAALMGGLGRTINGSYAEFTRAPCRTSLPSNRTCRGQTSQPSRKRTPRPGPAYFATWRLQAGRRW
jgi:NADPH:quinone reductase